MIPPIVEIRQPGKAPLRVAVHGEVEVGRECDGVILRDGKISRQHLSLRPADGGVTVTDLGSSNGTFVNGMRVEEPTVVGVGDVVALGDSELAMLDLSDFAETEQLSVEEVLAALADRDPPAETEDLPSGRPSEPGEGQPGFVD